ncbi:hypothetical protein BH09VER1_BH09VER1_17830 [soil metagenome]
MIFLVYFVIAIWIASLAVQTTIALSRITFALMLFLGSILLLSLCYAIESTISLWKIALGIDHTKGQIK